MSSFYSLYQATRYYTYQDTDGLGVTQTRTGYKNQNNLDCISRCNTLLDASCPMPASYDIATADSTGRTMFRVYVAPGTTQINLTSNCSDNFGKFVFAARMGSPPADCSAYANSLSDTGFDALPSVNGFTLSQLTAGDCIGRNSVGYIFIAGGGGLNVGASGGGWLYVQIVPFGGKSVAYTSFDDTVNTAAYLSWYNNLAAWDASGDPVEGSSGVISGNMSLSVSSLSFGYVAVNKTSSDTINLKNAGDSAIDISVTCPSGFSCSPSTCSVPSCQTQILAITFAPSGDKTSFAGNITISDGQTIASIPVSGTSTLTGGDGATADTPLHALIKDLATKLAKTSQAIDGIQSQIDALTVTQTTLTDVATPLVANSPTAKVFVDFHLNKLIGGFGQYGVNSQVSALTALKTKMGYEKTFYENAIDLYNKLDNGLDPGAVPYPDGYDPDDTVHPDKDHTESMYQLKQAADYHMKDRRTPVIYPDYSYVGDIISVGGIEMVCIVKGEPGTAQYYAIGLQEPEYPCNNGYPVCHTSCVVLGGT